MRLFSLLFVLFFSFNLFADEELLTPAEATAAVELFKHPKENQTILNSQYYALLTYDHSHEEEKAHFSILALINYIENYDPSMFNVVVIGYDPILKEAIERTNEIGKSGLIRDLLIALSKASQETVIKVSTILPAGFKSSIYLTNAEEFLQQVKTFAITNKVDGESVHLYTKTIIDYLLDRVSSANDTSGQMNALAEITRIAENALEIFDDLGLAVYMKFYSNKLASAKKQYDELNRVEDASTVARKKNDARANLEENAQKAIDHGHQLIPLDGLAYDVSFKIVENSPTQDNVFDLKYKYYERFFRIKVAQPNNESSKGIRDIALTLLKRGADGLYFDSPVEVPKELLDSSKFVVTSQNGHAIVRTIEKFKNRQLTKFERERPTREVEEKTEAATTPTEKPSVTPTPEEESAVNAGLRKTDLKESVKNAMRSMEPWAVSTRGTHFSISQVKYTSAIHESANVYRLDRQNLYHIQVLSQGSNPQVAYMDVINELFAQGAKGIYFDNPVFIPTDVLKDPRFAVYQKDEHYVLRLEPEGAILSCHALFGI